MSDQRWYELTWREAMLLAAWCIFWYSVLGWPHGWLAWMLTPVGLVAGMGGYSLVKWAWQH